QLIHRIHQLDTTYQPFHSEQHINLYSLNNVFVLPNNTVYSVNSIQRTDLQHTDEGLESKEVSPLGKELSLFDRPNEVERGRILKAHRLEPILQQQISQCMAPSHHDAEQNLAEPSIESNVKYKLGEELLKELHSNSYSERVEEDVVGHIAKILEILNLIKVADMDLFQLRMKTFPLSLSGEARKCNYDKMCDDDEEYHDPLEFITLGNNEGIMDEDVSNDDDRDHTNSSMITKPELKIGDEFLKILHDNSFNDKNIKSGLWEFNVNGRTKGTIDNLVKYSEPCKENSKMTSSGLFFKPYLDAQDEKDIYDIIVGSCKEFITVGPSKISTVKKNPGSMSCIYHELFNKRDRGWAITRTK
ncbi:hypothetical protein Tco_0494325, partial [Tanacetum coccineum]